jgi:UPF0042 nucleotide-binding protein
VKPWILVTGLSGSGKSSALHILEDNGFYCIDNLPFELLEAYLQKEVRKKKKTPVAIDMDVRDADFLKKAEKDLPGLKKRFPQLKVLFLTASEEVLVRRFSQTRRRHPLTEHGNLLKALRLEKKRLKKILPLADAVIDTTPLTVHSLKVTLEHLIAGREKRSKLPLSLISFGFRHGIPAQADLVFDLRFLPNPYFEPSLKALDGNHRKVQDFIKNRAETRVFIKKTKDFLDFLIPRYVKEGKSYLTVALGCTGGKHRSVALANHFKDYFTRKGLWVNLEHRDLHKKS